MSVTAARPKAVHLKERPAGAMTSEVLRQMEQLNAEVEHLNIWLRTRANAAGQAPWHLTDANLPPRAAPGALDLPSRAVPYLWKWKLIEPYLYKVAELCPLEETDRQQLLLTNPGFNGALKIANSIRVAISIYRPGDLAPTHMHTPNASRTILSDKGGYSEVEGEKCPAARGDLILTPNGTWHGHGNDDDTPVIWMDVLDWPLLEMLDLIWIRQDAASWKMDKRPAPGFSTLAYGKGGLVPRFQPFPRGTGKNVSPQFHYLGADVQKTLRDLGGGKGDPYEGVHIEFANPLSGDSVFPTLSYRAQLLKPGESTLPFRHTASNVYTVMEGEGATEVNGMRMEWSRSDVFVVPNNMWRRHINTSATRDAILYCVTDQPLIEKIGQYCAQGREGNGKVVELA
jgi:gentisate 1,2-dioxygenase